MCNTSAPKVDQARCCRTCSSSATIVDIEQRLEKIEAMLQELLRYRSPPADGQQSRSLSTTGKSLTFLLRVLKETGGDKLSGAPFVAMLHDMRLRD
jgi:hypothetical protein